ncbi:MAG: Cl- channel voltage-gated family protein [Candidatus Rokuibacteriota bacterium]|nr:MAG: Cl- channel voltage-gated family protein [Candidatus Rokubacteria bacterium]
MIRSRQYRVLLVLAALVGLIVSTASWGFLEVVHKIQVGVYENLPKDLGYNSVPTWWPLPWLALAGLLTAFAILRLPGRGGHVPADGLKTGGAPTQPIELPGVLLAALATLGLGLVLGPEAPLIAVGMGLGILSTRLVKKDAPQQALGLMAAAGSFAAISSIFGSPVIGAVLIIEAAGLGGATLPLVLLPGLVAAGIGSLVFIGLGSWSGFSTSAWALSPFPLQPFGGPSWGNFGWTILLSLGAAAAVFAIAELARWAKRLVENKQFVLTIGAGLAVGGLAIAFAQATDESPNAVLFSGENAFDALFSSAATVSVSTLVLLFLFKGLAWSVSLGNFRGGPTFPALFLGVVAGLAAAHLPGYAETQAVAALSGAMCVSILRLPLASVMIASLLCVKAGLAVTPLIVVAVVVAYLASEAMTAYVDSRVGARPGEPDSAATSAAAASAASR